MTTEAEHDDQGRVKLSSVPLDRDLSIICHKDDVEVVNDREDVLEITPESTLAMAAKFTDRTWAMAKADADFVRRFGIVFPDINLATDTRSLANMPLAVRHVVGLIINTNMAINTDRTPFWRNPECYLHPSSQTKLADLAVSYTKDYSADDDAGDE